MGLKLFLKKIVKKADESIDKTSDQMEDLSKMAYKTGTLIAEDAAVFAKSTLGHLKEASSEFSEKTKESLEDITEQAKEDFKEVKEIAKDQMDETKKFVTENIHKIENALKDKEDCNTADTNSDSIKTKEDQ